MKNIFKIILILCLGIFVVAGCADNSSGNGGGNTENTGGDNNGGNTGDGDNTGGDNTGGDNTQIFTKLISAKNLSYGETADGKRYVWGKEAGGLIGKWGIIEAPVEVDFTINKIVDGYNTVYVLTDAGLYAWGDNKYGQVGNGTTENVLNACKVEGITGTIKEVIISSDYYYNYTRYYTVYALTDDGLYAWGYNGYGQVGNGTTENVTKPYKAVEGDIKEFRVSGSDRYATYYVLTDTGLFAWGANKYGQAGNGTTENVTKPYKAVEGNIKEFRVSDSGSSATYYALTEDGLYIWGNNRYGQVGNGESGYEKGEDGEVDYSKPKQVLTPHKVEGITGNIKEFRVSGYNYSVTYALTDDGLYAWGNNAYGAVGNGTTEDGLTPHKAVEGNIKELIILHPTSELTTYYALTDNGLYAWGDNENGQVGNGESGSIKRVLTPYKAVDGNIKEIITGGMVYVLTDTDLYAWGYNGYGQVGNGTTDNVTKPHKVQGIEGNIKEIVYETGTVYVLTDSGLYAWGNNNSGQAGNGSTDNVTTPYKVEGIDGTIKEVISNGGTVYVLTDTGLYAWGYNGYGQAGNGTTENVTTPYKAVEGNIKEFRVSDSGSYATYYALTEDGLYIWGNNRDGQAGNGESGYEEAYNPKRVLTPYKAVEGNIKEFIISDYNRYSTYYALTDTGLYAWGDNEYGQVGNGESGYEKDENGNNNYSKPKQVLIPYKVKIEKQN